ncbi:MAG: TraR/DksA family transcriptional regulator [Candidatus Omnitrophica bacterium]|nr:TraR/DksA family transcriptional regulator [Candidatus Omnitrophota bacterium]
MGGRLDRKTLEEMKGRLERRLAELTKSLGKHDKLTSEPLPSDWEEASSIKPEMDVVESLERGEAKEIRMIRDALERMKEGTYGICAGCGNGIPVERLMARPDSELCVSCKEIRERKGR